MPKLRKVCKNDAAALVEIYRPYVENKTASLEYDTPSVSEFEKRIESISIDFPYIVCEEDNIPIGYAYAHKYKERFGYRFCAELTVYVAQGKTGQGVGRLLYLRLIKLLCEMGYTNLYAVITDPNPGSVALHKSFGFEEVGREHLAGVKFGEWHDVMLFEKIIAPHDKLSEERECPKRISDIGDKYDELLL